MFDNNNLKTAIRDYQKKVLKDQNFSLEQIKYDLKKLFEKHNVNASDLQLFSIDSNHKASTGTYIDSLTHTIYKAQMAKKQKSSEEQNNDKENQSHENDDNKDSKPFKGKKFIVSIQELKSWNESELKPKLTEKMLQAGFTHEELNATSSANYNFIDTNGMDTNLNISKNIPVIDQVVEMVKFLKQALESGQSLEEIVNNKANHQQIDQDSQLSEEDEPESDNQELDEANNEPEEDDQLSDEDLEEIEKYGIEGIKTPADLKAFWESDEGKQIQSTLENQFSKSDDY